MGSNGNNKRERNGNWKGDNIGYGGVHTWITRHLVKPIKCECCGEIKKLDSANISGKYLRDFNDWEFLCRRCHMTKDGRMKKLNDFSRNRKFKIIN